MNFAFVQGDNLNYLCFASFLIALVSNIRLIGHGAHSNRNNQTVNIWCCFDDILHLFAKGR